jgi:hypothetical protein
MAKNRKSALIGHSRGGRPIIDWGKLRPRDGNPPAHGSLWDLLLGQDIDDYVACDPSVTNRYGPWVPGMAAPVEDADEILRLRILGRLHRMGISMPSLDKIEATRHSIGRATARAWVCLDILLDRHCRVPFPGHRSDPQQPWSRRGNDESLCHTSHLLESASDEKLSRAGGLSEMDLGWLAKVVTRPQRARVRGELERLGVIRAVHEAGKQPRYMPVCRLPSTLFEKLFARRALQQVAAVAHGVAPGRRERAGSSEPWNLLEGTGLGFTFVVGPKLTPGAARFLQEQVGNFRRTMDLASVGHIPSHGFRRWLRRRIVARSNNEEKPSSPFHGSPFLIIPLGRARPSVVLSRRAPSVSSRDAVRGTAGPQGRSGGARAPSPRSSTLPRPPLPPG